MPENTRMNATGSVAILTSVSKPGWLVQTDGAPRSSTSQILVGDDPP